MKKAWLILWRWSTRRGAGFDCSSACIASLGLTIMLSQKLWKEWLHVPAGSGMLQYMATNWFFLAALFGVFWIESWQLARRFRETGHSRWWTLFLIFELFLLAGLPPQFGKVRAFLVITFTVSQLPLFVDRDLKQPAASSAP